MIQLASDNKQNILGYNSSDNQYNSSEVTPNADGSVIERLEYLQGLIATISGFVDTEIAAIKAKTDNLPSDPADQSNIDAKLGVVTDNAAHKTLLGYNNSLYQHAHQAAKCYPTLGNGVTIAGGAGVWALGNFVEFIPANAIANAFDIHHVNFESASSNDVYELVLYAGTAGNEVEIGRVRTYKTATTSGAINVPIQIPAQSANTRISAKLASASGGDNVTISVFYHIYE